MGSRPRAASEPAGGSSESQKIKPGTTVLLVVVLVLFGALAGFWALPARINLYKDAPLQVLLGSAVFISLICLVVLVFARLGLYNRSAALGLPEGSVRALIALILLIIFIIFANVIFGVLSNSNLSQPVAFSGLTEEQVRALGGPVENQRSLPSVAGEPQRWEGTYRVDAPSADAANLGQQVVTGMLTLVAAISAFYFGSASVTTGADAIRRSTSPDLGGGSLQVLRPSQPVVLEVKDGGGYNDLEIQLGGSALDAAGAQAAILSNDPEGRIRRGSTDTDFVYSPSSHPVNPVTLRFTSATNPAIHVDLLIGVPAA